MLDTNLLRKDVKGVADRLRARGYEFDVDGFNALEVERKSVQIRTEELQSRRNALSKQIGVLKSRGEDASAVMAEVGAIPQQVKDLESRLGDIQARLHEFMLNVPNVPHESVPPGASAEDNREVRRWGQPRAFDFAPRDHVDVGAALGLDFEVAAKISGSRFVVLKGPVARLHRALAQFMLDTQTAEHGYTECYTPYIVNRDTLLGTGQLPKFRDDMFWVTKGGGEDKERAVPDFHVRDLADEHGSWRPAARSRPADQTHGAHTVLPFRGGQLRQGHARHDPAAPVRQGRDGADRASGAILRSARGDGRTRGGHPAEAGAPVSRRCAVYR